MAGKKGGGGGKKTFNTLRGKFRQLEFPDRLPVFIL